MSKAKTGGSAFPWMVVLKPGDVVIQDGAETEITKNISNVQAGLTRRDYFAAQALAGLMMSLQKSGYSVDHPNVQANMAKSAYAMADRMLEESEGV